MGERVPVDHDYRPRRSTVAKYHIDNGSSVVDGLEDVIIRLQRVNTKHEMRAKL